MYEDLRGKVAIVTGAANNIGKAIAKRLAKEGANVVVADINSKAGIETCEDIKKVSRKSMYIYTDVTVESSVETLMRTVIDNFRVIDIIVNNAGGLAEVIPVVEMDETKHWNYSMDLNAKSVFLCSKHATKVMIPRKQGKIINISSNSGKTGIAYSAHYCAAKFAIIGFTQSLAQELMLYNINVNCICPGNMNLPMHLKAIETVAKLKEFKGPWQELVEEQKRNRIYQRLGDPEDVANGVAFLASSQANYITGQSINICGGREFH